MTLQELGSLGEFVGALGVVGSLAYVAFQIRQNTRSLRTASFQALMQSSTWENRVIAQNPALAELYLRGLDSYRELDTADQLRFSSLMYNLIWHFEITLSLYREGVSTDTRLEAQLASVLDDLERPGAAEWWESARIDAPVRAFIDARRAASS
jgi:hypothetical protein